MTNYINFDALCADLEVNSSKPSNQDLKKLVEWFEKNISTDIHFTGELSKCFNAYRAFISNFFTNVQPNINKSQLTSPVEQLGGMTALQYLAKQGLDVYLEKLNPTLEQINTKIRGGSLLQWAVVPGHLHTTKTLLHMGVKQQETTVGGSILFNVLAIPVIHDQSMKQNKQLIYKMLSQNAQHLLEKKDEAGDTILHLMSTDGYDELIKQVLKSPAKKLAFISNNLTHYPIHSAILSGQRDCVKLLIAVENVEQLTDSKGHNALHYATKYGDLAMAQICLPHISINSVTNSNQTPLIIASIAQNTQIVKLLLDEKADINQADDRQRTALHYAVESDSVEIVRLLLSTKNIHVNMDNDDSQNPLDLIQLNTAAGREIKELLLEKGAMRYRNAARI